MAEEKDEDGVVFMGRNHDPDIDHTHRPAIVSLPPELRDGGVMDFGHATPIGYVWNGKLHYFRGKGPWSHPGWTWEGEVDNG